jgi:diguanylate cyclase (GGDEF)-like protein
MSHNQLRPAKIFICYSHKDKKWLQRLRVHLKPMEREGRIEAWDDTRIDIGSKWLTEIQEAIRNARVAILLVSADFLASDFIDRVELPSLLRGADAGIIEVVPVIVSPCSFASCQRLGEYQALNGPDKPLSDMKRTDAEKVLVRLGDHLRKIVRDEVRDDTSFFSYQTAKKPNVILPRADEPGSVVEHDKAKGTHFVETELPKIIENLRSREKKKCAIVFIDIDGLTGINTRFGWERGNAVLDIVFEQIRRRGAARYCGRCGDDTFYAVLIDTGKVLSFCNGLRVDIKNYLWSVVAHGLYVTCTIGYATLRLDESPHSFFARSIQGMLEGKKSGGNVAQSGASQPGLTVQREATSPVNKGQKWARSWLTRALPRDFSLRKFFS